MCSGKVPRVLNATKCDRENDRYPPDEFNEKGHLYTNRLNNITTRSVNRTDWCEEIMDFRKIASLLMEGG